MNDYVRFFFGFYLLLGSWLVSDYGISTDEPVQRKHGMVTFEYINEYFGLFSSVPAVTGENLSTYDHRDYGMFFQTVAYGLELLLGIDNSRDVFQLRHMMVFFLFWLSTVFFYKTLNLRYRSPWIGLAGVLFLVFSPRIFANAFYNPKDIPLLCWVVIGTYTMVQYMVRKDTRSVVWHALACSLAIGSRVVGVVLPVVTLIWLLLEQVMAGPDKKGMVKTLIRYSAYLCFLLIFTVIFWPVLWENPVDSFLFSFNSMKKFRWYGSMLYMGEMVRSTALPWHYIPVWILVTTPVAVSLLFIAGLSSMTTGIIQNIGGFFRNRDNRMDFIILVLFAIPLFAVIFLGSVLYNGWRHLYFIYPAMVWIAIRGMVSMYLYLKVRMHRKRLKWVAYGLIAGVLINFSETLYFMVRYHPHQNVYFNKLAGDVERNFERDYYGLSYKRGLSDLLEYDNRDTLRLYSRDFIGKINTMNFTKKEAGRLKFVENPDEAGYFISLFNFRDEKEHRDFVNGEFPYDRPEIISIWVKNYRIINIYKLYPELK